MIEERKIAVTYKGDGSTSVFPFSFAISSADTVCVSIYDGETGVESEITKDYFVDIDGKAVHYPGYAAGEAPPASEQPPKLQHGKMITIYRKTPVNQLTNLGYKYPLPQIESMVDKATAILQEHEDALDRCIKTTYVSETSPDELFERLKRGSEDAEMFALRAENASGKVEGAANTAAEALAESKELRDAVDAETRLLEYVKRVTDALNVAKIDFFEVDINGDIMPSEEPIYDVNYELDENGDIMPKE
ncbi:hypothetical protein TAMA11512_09240 [Selenomonas sp. TAMA-11512]|uniref:hypothetical protein n=1 Tax=Selenomonas sp. TAMA-11512 TaxID=3095337 RepID=UPI00308668D3|nr:hypothetical protein TAMA11512_09240 [Selenomonas sp. TAMA-11512]